MTKLNFTTSNPGFMGSTEDRDEKFISEMADPDSRVLSPDFLGKEVTAYIHGEAEDIVGYDIPIWLSGRINKMKIQPCSVYSRSGDAKLNCFLIFREQPNRWLGYICLGHEVEETINALGRNPW